MKRMLPLMLMLFIVLSPLSSAGGDGAESADTGYYGSYFKKKGDVKTIPSTHIDFNLSLSQLGVFDAGFSSTKVIRGDQVPPANVQVAYIDSRIPDSDMYRSSTPVYMYLRFFGNKVNAPVAEVKVNGPLTGVSSDVRMHWKVGVSHIDPAKGVAFELRSDGTGISSKAIAPIFDGQPDTGLVNIVDCYEVVFETTEEYWKAPPASFAGELWFSITTVN